MNNLTKYISGNNALTPVTSQENPTLRIPVSRDLITGQVKSTEEKLTTILIILTILALLLTF